MLRASRLRETGGKTMKELTIREACALIGEGKWNELETAFDSWERPQTEADAVHALGHRKLRHNPPLPDGEITLDQAREAVKAGKPVEFRCDLSKTYVRYAPNLITPLSDRRWDLERANYHFRLAPEQKPKPKKVPLCAEDVLVTTQFRPIGTNARHGYYSVSSYGVYSDRSTSASFSMLMKAYERTDDSGRTWQPCWKLEGGAE